jgi:Na+-driven multidrug efflux pump
VLCLQFLANPLFLLLICSRELADKTTHSPYVKSKVIRHLINTSIVVGGGVASALALTTFLQQDSILRGLTTNTAIRSAAASVFPAVLLTQVFKGFAYPVNGIIMGGLDWVFSMWAMWAANIVCIGMVKAWSMGGAVISMGQIWLALAAFMGTQVVTGIIRFQSKTGVWEVLRHENDLQPD